MLQILRQIRAVARLEPFDTSTAEGRSQERYRRIVFTTASAIAVRAVGVAVGLVTVPLLLGYLGKEGYGLWTAITTVVSWATLFDFGLSNGLLNLISRAHGREDAEEATRLFSTAFLALSALAIPLALATAVALPWVPWASLLGARGAMDEGTVRAGVAVALGAFIVSLPLGTVSQLYSGYQKTYLTNAFALLGSVFTLGAIALAIHLKAPLPLLVLAVSATGLLPPLLALGYARKALPWIRVRARHASRAALRALTERSVPIFLYQVGALAVNETQVLILARRSGLATVTDYSVATRLYLVIVSVIQLGTSSFVPPFREARERGDHAWALRAFRHLQAVRLGLALAGGAALVLLGNPLLKFWLHRGDMAFSWVVWGAYAALLLAVVWITVYVEFLWIMDRLWPLVGFVVLNGISTVGITWALAPSQGVLGAVVASGAFNILVLTWVLPLIARPLLVPDGQAH